MTLTIEFWETNVRKIFMKQRDLDIANAVIELLRNSGRIEAFNKKALYLYIREISECKTQQITKIINKMKQYHRANYKTENPRFNRNTFKKACGYDDGDNWVDTWSKFQQEISK